MQIQETPQVDPQQNLSVTLINVRPLVNKINTVKTANLIKTDELMVKRVVLLAGQSIPKHHVAGDATVYCIEGTVDFTAADQTFRLNAGELFLLKAGTEHSLLGVQNASILVTIHL